MYDVFMSRIPWNKGLTKEDLRVAKNTSNTKSQFKKGQTPWNKGLKGVIIPWNKGIPRTEEEKRKMSLAKLGKPNPLIAGDLNPMYKPDRNIGYAQKHRVMRKKFEDIKVCQKCGSDYDLELSNISGKYLLEESDWQKLCINCHKKYDNIVRNFKSKQST